MKINTFTAIQSEFLKSRMNKHKLLLRLVCFDLTRLDF